MTAKCNAVSVYLVVASSVHRGSYSADACRSLQRATTVHKDWQLREQTKMTYQTCARAVANKP